ncbi:MAG: nuclear transport factor 2 family protein [Planctomycetes bacterium]|nr:nuclear transport factor 2 family protein [Planctomycetota bacterium]
MSQENVEIVRGIYRATGPEEDFYAILDEDIEWDATNTRAPDAGVYRGLPAFKRAYGAWRSAWDCYEVTADEVMEAGDSVVAITRQRGRGRQSGISVDQPMVAVYTFRNRKVVRFGVYATKAEALEAVGLSE